MNLTHAPCNFNYMYRTLVIELLERIVIPLTYLNTQSVNTQESSLLVLNKVSQVQYVYR